MRLTILYEKRKPLLRRIVNGHSRLEKALEIASHEFFSLRWSEIARHECFDVLLLGMEVGSNGVLKDHFN